MKIFLVAGKSGSGKKEIAKIINEFYIYKLKKCVITEYSKYLKLYARELTDWDGGENKPRDFLQEFGAKIRKNDEKFFVRRMIEDLNIYDEVADIVIIDDVRMPAEVEDIKANFQNVYSIYVENQFSKSNLTIKQQSDITETALETYTNFDYTIANDELNVLHDKIFKILEGIEG